MGNEIANKLLNYDGTTLKGILKHLEHQNQTLTN